MSSAEAPKLLGEVPHVRVAAWGRFVVTVVGNDATESSLEVFRESFDAIQSRYPGGYFAVTVLEGLPKGLIKPSARTAARDIMGQYSDRVHASVIVIEGDERYLVALRAMVNLLSRAMPQRADVHVEANVAEAAAWLADKGAPPMHNELIGVVNMLRPGADLGDAAFW